MIHQRLEELLRDFREPSRAAGLYNFSAIKGQTSVSKFGLQYLSSRVTLVFSSLSKELVDELIRRIFSIDFITIGNMVLTPGFVEEEILPEFGIKGKYLTISPLVTSVLDDEEKTKMFIDPSEDSFSDFVYESTIHRMMECGKYTAEQLESYIQFQIVPDEAYLNRIAHEEKKIARIYPVYSDNGKVEVRGYTFPFELFADEEVQKFIWLCGIGALSFKGFGMVDMANNEVRRQTREYSIERDGSYLPK